MLRGTVQVGEGVVVKEELEEGVVRKEGEEEGVAAELPVGAKKEGLREVVVLGEPEPGGAPPIPAAAPVEAEDV